MQPLWNFVELARVVAAFAAVYLLVPVAALRYGGQRGRSCHDFADAFLQSIFFIQVTVLILGDWRLCLPGSLGTLYVIWAGLTAAFASRERWLFDNFNLSGKLISVYRWLEQGQTAARKPSSWGLPGGVPAHAISVTLVLAFAYYARFPVQNLRFLAVETYSKTLSLQVLVHGGVWERDGGVAPYAPIVFLSGLDSSLVVPMLAPVMVVVLLASCGYCAFVFSRRLTTAYLASSACALFLLLIGPDSPGEAGGRELATALWILAVATMPRSFNLAALAATTAALLGGGYPPSLVPFLGLIFGALAATVATRALPPHLPQLLQRAAMIVPMALVGVVCISPRTQANANTEYQYESAARVTAEIAASFRQNDWVIVSPGAEIAQVFGRGWHVELSEFVSTYSIDQVSNPSFRFPYAPTDIFIFLEKRPLDQAARHIAFDSGKSAFYYSTRLGRSSMEFQAARVTAAYARTHTNAAVYYQDNDIIVYRIGGSIGRTRPRTDSP